MTVGPWSHLAADVKKGRPNRGALHFLAFFLTTGSLAVIVIL